MDEVLATEAARLGLNLSDRKRDLMRLHYDEMLVWNERVNLTSITAPNAAAVRHFADSLAVAAALEQTGFAARLAGERAMDVGSGGGFPGLPLKVYYPDLRVVCLDSVGKKTAFIQHMADLYTERELSGTFVITGRAEDVAHQPQQRANYLLVVSRAVASLAVLAEYCLPFLKVGGVLAAPKKGLALATELSEARPALKKLGAGKVEIYDFTLPLIAEEDLVSDEREERQVVLIHKQSTTPPQYPRQAGTPSRKPL